MDKREFKQGQIVKHFKRDITPHCDNDLLYLYEIIGIVEHTETKEKLMCYKALYTNKVYVRPLDMFYSEVDKEKYPNVKQKYRFEVL